MISVTYKGTWSDELNKKEGSGVLKSLNGFSFHQELLGVIVFNGSKQHWHTATMVSDMMTCAQNSSNRPVSISV